MFVTIFTIFFIQIYLAQLNKEKKISFQQKKKKYFLKSTSGICRWEMNFSKNVKDKYFFLLSYRFMCVDVWCA